MAEPPPACAPERGVPPPVQSPASVEPRKSTRVPGGQPLENKKFVRFLEDLKSNNSEDIDCEGRVLRLKRHIPPGAKPGTIDLVLDALAVNTRVEVLYIQNFEYGFFDEQLFHLVEVLKLRRIWGLNVGENFGVSIPAWEKFTNELQHTAVTHMYASEHHFRGTDLKLRMREAIRANRGKKLTPKPHSIEAIMECGNMWYNPKLPKWAVSSMDKTSAEQLLARQQAASSSSDAAQCKPPPGTQQHKDLQRLLARTPGKRMVKMSEKSIQLADERNDKEIRSEWQNIVSRREKRRRAQDDNRAGSVKRTRPLNEAKRPLPPRSHHSAASRILAAAKPSPQTKSPSAHPPAAKKKPPSAAAAAAAAAAGLSGAPVKRGRGRPRKYPLPALAPPPASKLIAKPSKSKASPAAAAAAAAAAPTAKRVRGPRDRKAERARREAKLAAAAAAAGAAPALAPSLAPSASPPPQVPPPEEPPKRKRGRPPGPSKPKPPPPPKVMAPVVVVATTRANRYVVRPSWLVQDTTPDPTPPKAPPKSYAAAAAGAAIEAAAAVAKAAVSVASAAAATAAATQQDLFPAGILGFGGL